jgi:hypothetical protein
MKQCCVSTFRRDYLPWASWYLPQKIICAHLVTLLQILPQYNKQEAPVVTRFFAGSQPLATKCESRHVTVPVPFLHHRYFGPYYQRYCTQITITVLYCTVTQHTYPAVREILISLANHLYFHCICNKNQLICWFQLNTIFPTGSEVNLELLFLLRHHWRIFV